MYKALDTFNGFKKYSKKTQAKPITSIIENTLPITQNEENIHILVHSHDLFVKFTNVKTNKSLSAFVRKNENISLRLPNGEYKFIYIGGEVWCGKEDLFKEDYMRGEFSQNIVINGSTVIFLGEKAVRLSNSYTFLSNNYLSLLTNTEWNKALLALEQSKRSEEEERYKKKQKNLERMNNPNYYLKINDNLYKFN